MSVIVILILVSLSIALAFLGAFIWAVRSGQYDDTSTPSLRILAEDAGDGRESESRNQKEVRSPKSEVQTTIESS